MSQDSTIIVEPSQANGADPNVVQTTKTVTKPALTEIKLPDDDSVDPTYRGKSAAELIEMHKNAASRIGAQGQELGVWRSLVSELSQHAKQAPTVEPKTAPKITSDALLTDPSKAISEVVRHELESALRPIKESRTLDQREAELAALNSDFPGYVQTGNDPAFQQWATGARGRSADARAAASGDLSAARRLLEAWEDRKSLTQTQTQQTTDTGKPQGTAGARQATTEAGGSGRSQSTGKILNRAEIVQMIIDKPDVYASDAFQAELMQAAKEGRIR